MLLYSISSSVWGYRDDTHDYPASWQDFYHRANPVTLLAWQAGGLNLYPYI